MAPERRFGTLEPRHKVVVGQVHRASSLTPFLRRRALSLTSSGLRSGTPIAAGVPLFELSCFMGTSVEQIGRTYGHLLPDSIERARTALDVFLAAVEKPKEAFRD